MLGVLLYYNMSIKHVCCKLIKFVLFIYWLTDWLLYPQYTSNISHPLFANVSNVTLTNQIRRILIVFQRALPLGRACKSDKTDSNFCYGMTPYLTTIESTGYNPPWFFLFDFFLLARPVIAFYWIVVSFSTILKWNKNAIARILYDCYEWVPLVLRLPITCLSRTAFCCSKTINSYFFVVFLYGLLICANTGLYN